MKKTCSMMALVAFLTVLAMSFFTSNIANAYTGIAVYANRFQKCFVCTLKNSRNAGSVQINMFTQNPKCRNYTVRMTDESGNYIWGEDGALRSPSGSRTFRLGNDHKVYKIYISGNGGSGNVGTATIGRSSNVSIRTSDR